MHKVEEVWLTISSAILVLFMLIIGYQTVALGMGPPSNKDVIDPQKVDQTPPFDKPGITKVGENEYDVVMTLQAFSFNPSNIEIPAGSKVNFILTSKDVSHGFAIAGTNANTMVLPGHIQRISQTFHEPGSYLVLCNEYCGAGHQLMATTITVK